MGWCSATRIFDDVAGFVLATDKPGKMQSEVLSKLASSLEDGDWDCQQDSDYWDHPIVQAVFKELHPDWDWSEDEDKPLTALQQTILKRLAGGYTLEWSSDGWTVYRPIPAPDIEENRLAVNDLLARGYLVASGATAETISITATGIEALAPAEPRS